MEGMARGKKLDPNHLDPSLDIRFRPVIYSPLEIRRVLR